MNKNWLLAILAAAIFFVGCGASENATSSAALVTPSNNNVPTGQSDSVATSSEIPTVPTTAEEIFFDTQESDLSGTTLQTAIIEINEKVNSANQAVASLQAGNNCPSAMSKIFEQYCIDNDERTTTHFDNALKSCGLEGKSLCSIEQYYTACSQNTLFPAVINLKNNYEWTKDLQFSYDTYSATYDANATRIGFNNCAKVTYHANFASTSVKAPFRCCKTL